MPNFPINTQEEWDAAVAEEYGDVAGLQEQIASLTGERDTNASTIADLQKQLNQFKLSDLRRSVAQKKGIPLEFASRLAGETEKEINADADAMAALLKAQKGTAPLFDPTPKEYDPKKAEYSEMLRELRGE